MTRGGTTTMARRRRRRRRRGEWREVVCPTPTIRLQNHRRNERRRLPFQSHSLDQVGVSEDKEGRKEELLTAAAAAAAAARWGSQTMLLREEWPWQKPPKDAPRQPLPLVRRSAAETT